MKKNNIETNLLGAHVRVKPGHGVHADKDGTVRGVYLTREPSSIFGEVMLLIATADGQLFDTFATVVTLVDAVPVPSLLATYEKALEEIADGCEGPSDVAHEALHMPVPVAPTRSDYRHDPWVTVVEPKAWSDEIACPECGEPLSDPAQHAERGGQCSRTMPDDDRPRAGHKHTCLDCGKVIEEGVFDCDNDRDHDWARCDDCVGDRLVSAHDRARAGSKPDDEDDDINF